MPNWLKTAFRSALLCILLYILFRGLNLEEAFAACKQAFMSPRLCLTALGVTCVGLLFNSFRWKIILHQLDYRSVSYLEAVRWVWIGQFFNAFLPGACGGDLVRGWYVVRGQRKGKRTEALTSVVIDRLFGLWVLILWAGCAILLLQPGDGWHLIRPLMLLLGLGALTAPLALCFFPTGMIEARWPIVQRVKDSFLRCLRSPATVLMAILSSVGNLASLTFAAYLFSRALGAEILIENMYLFFPTVTVLSSIPVTPGALGVRENLMVLLGGSLALAPEAAVVLSFLVYLSGILVGAAGGLLFVLDQRGTSKGLRDQLREISKPNAAPR